jgi:hypothetical protein
MRKEKIYHRCMDCRNAYLMRNGSDPIISKCPFNAERQVSSCPVLCSHFAQLTGKPQIHPMIFLK